VLRTESLDVLLSRYRGPLLTHLLSARRLPREQAEDILQGFLHGKVLRDGLVSGADQARGRFRTYLLTALDRFLVSEFRKQNARKRCAAAAVPLEEHAEVIADPAATADAFDLAWAREVLAQTARRMRAECLAAGRTDVWTLFEQRILLPSLDGQPGQPYEDLVRELGIASPSAAYNLLLTGKRMFARQLEAVVGGYAGDRQAVAEEVRDLHAILAGARKMPPLSAYNGGEQVDRST
jgi:RNA polymerase sigma-70 factor (ECF subfamily)